MSFPRYDKYKDSGHEWIGVIPAHWGAGRIKNVLVEMGSGGTPDTDDPTMWSDAEAGVAWVAIGDMSSVDTVLTTAKAITPNGIASKRLRVWPRGTLLFSMYASLGHVAELGIDAAINQAILALLPGHSHQPYLRSWLAFLQPRLFEQSSSNTQDNLNAEKVRNLPIARPPLEEQAAIATFLDHETAKIDTLVEEQKRLIELLKEKRQAVISHAVTKGLSPDVPMKESGVEWLGDVPAHWKVRAIKHIVSTPITDGPHETPNFPDEGVPFVSAEAVSAGYVNFDKIRGFISEQDHLRYSEKCRPKRGDIFMVKSGATTGVTAIVETDLDFNIWSPLAVIRCGNESDPYFVLNFMRSKNFLEAVTLNWSFGTQQNIGMGVIENLAVTVPPIDEQRLIAEFLVGESNRLDALTAEANSAMKLLQERRTALISAAVTGKIDVRARVEQAEVAVA